LLLVHVTVYHAQERRVLLPVDEAVSRPDFFTFRARLAAAVAQRDVAAILDAVHPDIKSSFGGDDGIEDFKRMWRLDESDSMFWKEFGTVLALGGSFDDTDAFTAPYTFSRWPNDVDAFDYVAVVGSQVRIRSLPRADASVISQASYRILQLDREATSKDWTSEEFTAIKIDGRKGYIATRFIRSSVDYRAQFRNIGGRWWLSFFVAGD
jgi:hypothetical protein